MKLCKKCGHINSDSALNCVKCGSSLGESIHTKFPPSGKDTDSDNGDNGDASITHKEEIPESSDTKTEMKRHKSINMNLFRFIGGIVFVLLLFTIFYWAIFKGAKMTSMELEENYGSGVVLILNSSYFSATRADGRQVYFTFNEEEGVSQPYLNLEDVEAQHSSGTGFFVSSNGEIATNNHVITQSLPDEIINELQKYVSNIICHSSISIAYNNSDLSSDKDLVKCNVVSSDKEHDLAIIQLESKKTPSAKHIFQVENEDPIESYSFIESISKDFGNDKNEKITMIGFNWGPDVAYTSHGIKAQCTTGSISQLDDDVIMYSIPTLSGSSGSPVLNQNGELIAINFAKLSSTQSFNYGVKSKYLSDLLKR